jgi:hypothetical protein
MLEFRRRTAAPAMSDFCGEQVRAAAQQSAALAA